MNELNLVQPAKDGPIGAWVLSTLREQIVKMQLKPGERLSEKEISTLLGVSRQPVREAFIKMADIGLLSVRPQRGTFVKPISIPAVKDAQFVRMALEGEIVSEVAQCASDEQIAELRKQIVAQSEFPSENSPGFMVLDELFHKTLASIVNRLSIQSFIQNSKLHMDRVRYLSAREFPHAELVEQHSRIVEAIAKHDPVAAKQAMSEHLRKILDDLPIIAKAHPEYFTE
ncbi:GntR family transcriptional regulator [Vibrio nigripulchritudo ATCC 27043]|uniref:GntR family transcriptional regulator n=1 Tax=Vibrio nigripulchritudo TaxID=28173 RepID=UPI00021C1BED|nr:GntR family transcriptional regulator [Vibrio nigripulchritudo]EGU57620.1 GntR family transcriptional regulator [Vibrio nigripulchritudo ATCC 27043]CCN36223.1 putative Uncharacterized HTH-type transcriptional regulator ydfH [Vibrio nigripulchritudo AM115]CCN43032.1 putative Uncharacterized HTH-type transcriptional regulator ydfH [Vibrio nigripulchritudo FTn2]CCN65047.1 putative Uncharacterized HTH-type transcriptional regulator ydfH [Vibrio nigripulchritudo POn4]CCN77784.1 putative Uncharac